MKHRINLQIKMDHIYNLINHKTKGIRLLLLKIKILKRTLGIAFKTV